MGILHNFAKRNEALADYSDLKIDAELEEINNWLDMARHRANMIGEIEKKMRKIRKSLLDEKSVRIDKKGK